MRKNLNRSLVVVLTSLGIIGTGALALTQVYAQTNTKTDTSITTAQAPPNTSVDPTKGGHIGTNSTKEELLTGDTAEKVKAAALSAVPGGTIERVETDAEGATYEAHMTKSDGSHVTVKFDNNFNVTATEDGMGKIH